jgi:hypothetical protein
MLFSDDHATTEAALRRSHNGALRLHIWRAAVVQVEGRMGSSIMRSYWSFFVACGLVSHLAQSAVGARLLSNLIKRYMPLAEVNQPQLIGHRNLLAIWESAAKAHTA